MEKLSCKIRSLYQEENENIQQILKSLPAWGSVSALALLNRKKRSVAWVQVTFQIFLVLLSFKRL